MSSAIASVKRKYRETDDSWPVRNRVGLLGSPPDPVGVSDNTRGPSHGII